MNHSSIKKKKKKKFLFVTIQVEFKFLSFDFKRLVSIIYQPIYCISTALIGLANDKHIYIYKRIYNCKRFFLKNVFTFLTTFSLLSCSPRCYHFRMIYIIMVVFFESNL